MRRTASLTVMAMVSAGAVLGSCGRTSESESALIARGKELTVECNSCHTPKVFTDHGPVPDTTRTLSGHPQGVEIPELNLDQMEMGWVSFNDHLTCWAGPWGVSFARNLTPDPETGIGSWSEETFIKVLRSGRHLGDDRLMAQPMPWLAVREDSEEDLRAIFAYLHTLEPIKNQVPNSITLEELNAAQP